MNAVTLLSVLVLNPELLMLAVVLTGVIMAAKS